MIRPIPGSVLKMKDFPGFSQPEDLLKTVANTTAHLPHLKPLIPYWTLLKAFILCAHVIMILLKKKSKMVNTGFAWSTTLEIAKAHVKLYKEKKNIIEIFLP